jgi:hypothetical protein
VHQTAAAPSPESILRNKISKLLPALKASPRMIATIKKLEAKLTPEGTSTSAETEPVPRPAAKTEPVTRPAEGAASGTCSFFLSSAAVSELDARIQANLKLYFDERKQERASMSAHETEHQDARAM